MNLTELSSHACEADHTFNGQLYEPVASDTVIICQPSIDLPRQTHHLRCLLLAYQFECTAQHLIRTCATHALASIYFPRKSPVPYQRRCVESAPPCRRVVGAGYQQAPCLPSGRWDAGAILSTRLSAALAGSRSRTPSSRGSVDRTSLA